MKYFFTNDKNDILKKAELDLNIFLHTLKRC